MTGRGRCPDTRLQHELVRGGHAGNVLHCMHCVGKDASVVRSSRFDLRQEVPVEECR